MAKLSRAKRALVCKLRRHRLDGTYQGYVPDIFLDEVCCECGFVLKTWQEVFKSYPVKTQLEMTKKYDLVDGYPPGYYGLL